jgi:hypothetical protein
MPKARGPSRVRENDIARTVQGVLKGGGHVRRVIIGPDNVAIECGDKADNENDQPEDIVELLK